MVAEKIPEPKFETCELRGGPHDGHVVNVPSDQARLSFCHAGVDHAYYKLDDRQAFFVHEAIVSGMFGSRP
ncbi:MAG: hypothetical protein AAF593_00695 [Planctomycetota bacterium]